MSEPLENNALETEQAYRLSVSNRAFAFAMAQLTAGYPEAEISSWERQRAEAVAWGDDPSVLTPWIDVAAQTRDIPRAEFLARTLDKVNKFAFASAYLIGMRQGIEDAIAQAQTPGAVAAIFIDYTLPEAE